MVKLCPVVRPPLNVPCTNIKMSSCGDQDVLTWELYKNVTAFLLVEQRDVRYFKSSSSPLCWRVLLESRSFKDVRQPAVTSPENPASCTFIHHHSYTYFSDGCRVLTRDPLVLWEYKCNRIPGKKSPVWKQTAQRSA